MSKRIDIDDKSFRIRRGKLVEIPSQWIGKVPTTSTINNRPSKQNNKQARDVVRFNSKKPSMQARLADLFFNEQEDVN